VSTDVTPPDPGESPITSMLDQSETQRTPSRLVEEHQSNIYDDSDHINASPSPVSFQTYGYRTPSKMTYTMSRESDPSLSSEDSKSVHSRQLSKVLLSRTDLSNKDVDEQKSLSNIEQSINKRSNKNLTPYKTHVNIFSQSRSSFIFFTDWQSRFLIDTYTK
jgi:hypothetical protein